MPEPCFSPSVVVRSLKPTKDPRLGTLLPYQQSNPAENHLLAKL